MTYEEALEKWARKKFPDIPEDAYGFQLLAEHESGYALSEVTFDGGDADILLRYQILAKEPWNGVWSGTPEKPIWTPTELVRVELVQGFFSTTYDFGQIVREIVEISHEQ